MAGSSKQWLGDGTKAVSNRDVNPSGELAHAHPELACLIHNQKISQAFAHYESVALGWKRFYTLFGRLSLIAVLLAMMSFDYQITLKELYGSPAFLANIAAVFAATGLVSQALLGFTHAKDRWLSARFAAERLRCFKFQLFSAIEEVSNAHELSVRVAQRTSEGLAALQQEMMGGRSAIVEFSPFDVLSPAGARTRHVNETLLASAVPLYEALRFSVQSQHFEEQFRAHDQDTKFPSLVSEFSFMAGAVLACIGILTALLPPGTPLFRLFTEHGISEWLDFLTWMLFVISAVVAIYERGSSHQQNAERYVTYGREIRRIRGGATAHMPASFFQAVHEMEHLMLREIQDFCRDVKHSNYVF